ncbi:MAG: hypothetical protein B6I26_06715 [Desulfobacteraceae bacterium 4572_130]|nr:MAG: hypothetical protein B6I26_06715 [Desulfobacteraceae bacterium 4572_130]
MKKIIRSLKYKLNKLLKLNWVIYFIFIIVKSYILLLHVKIENEKKWLKHVKNGGLVLLCGFHQHFFSIFRYFKKYKKFKPIAMVSKSNDGDRVAPFAHYTGWQVARGSSSFGGKQAMEEIINALSKGKSFIGLNLVDGPRGPIGKVKPGAIRIAQKSGAFIVPFFVIAESSWHLNSWDNFMIPKPFSKVIIKFGNMIKTDSINNSKDFEEKRKSLEKIMSPYLVI